MTDTPMVSEVDCSTGVVNHRPMTVEEMAVRDQVLEDSAAREAEFAAADEAKAAAAASAADKLAKLGLTEEEIAALRG